MLIRAFNYTIHRYISVKLIFRVVVLDYMRAFGKAKSRGTAAVIAQCMLFTIANTTVSVNVDILLQTLFTSCVIHISACVNVRSLLISTNFVTKIHNNGYSN